MFSDKLFDHKYDIDELISAFCGEIYSKKWCLNTKNGSIKKIDDDDNIIDGSENNHIHIIESLPKSFLNELIANSEFKKLSKETQNDLLKLVSICKSVNDLTKYFNNGDAGAYIIKSIKLACLEWLDMRNLIPPSMQHNSDMSMFNGFIAGEKTKVKISIT